MGSGNRFLNLPRVVLAAIIAVLAAQPIGKIVQRRLTTYADLGEMVITGVTRSTVGPWPSHRIDTAFWVRIGEPPTGRASGLGARDVPVAQWIERLPSKQWVVGSNPSRDAIHTSIPAVHKVKRVPNHTPRRSQ